MKGKVFRFLGSLTLIWVLCFGVPSPLFASSANDSDVELTAYSKAMTDSRHYMPYETVKTSITYNDGTWSGTLYLVGQQDVGGYHYSHLPRICVLYGKLSYNVIE